MLQPDLMNAIPFVISETRCLVSCLMRKHLIPATTVQSMASLSLLESEVRLQPPKGEARC